jgi:hypothetical protein
MAIAAILHLHSSLKAAGRLSEQRARAIASFLWQFIYSGFPSHPIYWHRVALHAIGISRETGKHRLSWAPKWIPAIALEWVLLPVRALMSQSRRILGNRRRPQHRRTL